jgi:hypothetical protein
MEKCITPGKNYEKIMYVCEKFVSVFLAEVSAAAILA